MLKYFEIMYVKGQGNLQTQQLMSIQTVLDQVFINNRQPSKALKFSSQSSTLEKNNHQLSKLPTHWDPHSTTELRNPAKVCRNLS